MFCSIMDFKLKGIKTINEFIGEELLKKMNMRYAPKYVKEQFKIVPYENGIWKHRKKEQEKR